MHSAARIKTSNHQAALDLTLFPIGGTAIFTPLGEAVGSEQELDVTSNDGERLIAGGSIFNPYLGSIQTHQGKLGVLEPAAA